MNTPSKEALEAAEKTQDYLGFPRRATNDLAAIIDRHFEQLHRDNATLAGRLTVAELERDGLGARAEKAEKLEAESRLMFYEEQDKRQSAEYRCEELAGALREARLYVAGHTNNTAMHLHKLISTVLARHAAGEPDPFPQCSDHRYKGTSYGEPAKHPLDPACEETVHSVTRKEVKP